MTHGGFARLDIDPGHAYLSLAAASHRLPALARAPRTIRILVENMLRAAHTAVDDARAWPRGLECAAAVLEHAAGRGTPIEIEFRPTRVVLQDHSGVPVLLDLAALRNVLHASGAAPTRVTPRLPVDLVVDHSVEAHAVGTPDAVAINMEREFALNADRYRFLRWAQEAFPGLRVVPPGRGIVHQIHLEHLASVVALDRTGLLVPDTVLGTDSHTPMVNALGVLGWGVGGIEVTAVLAGLPVSLLSPAVIGVRLTGTTRPGTVATDIALALTSFLREVGVVGSIVEFVGPGVRSLSVPDRATIANMAPEYGSTAAFFAVDAAVLEYLRRTGRDTAHVRVVDAYTRVQGLFDDGTAAAEPVFDRLVEFDVSAVGTVLAGPRRPQDRLGVGDVSKSFDAIVRSRQAGGPSINSSADPDAPADGAVAIAAITSCTNTANPRAMFAAGLVARRAARRGLRLRPWVKASLSPGSRTVTDYLAAAGVLDSLAALGFDVAGYGCMTCIGNAGPLAPRMAQAVAAGVRAVAVLSGNRNFEGRIHSQLSGAYLASPAMVVAYALAGTVRIDLSEQPLGRDHDGAPVYLADLMPDEAELDALGELVQPELFRAQRERLFVGDERWQELHAPPGPLYDWPSESTYIRPPALAARAGARGPADIHGARLLVWVGHSTTTDHISPAGAIPSDSVAGAYLRGLGVTPADFNSYGCRRGNSDVMVRGTFANPRLRNLLMPPDRPGGWTKRWPGGEETPVFDAAQHYAAVGTPVIVLAGRDYGMGSSRDWAARGQQGLGVRAVLAESFERIHRSNLVGVGIVPLEFLEDAGAGTHALSGSEQFEITGLRDVAPRGVALVRATAGDGRTVAEWKMRVRIDTNREMEYVRAGGFVSAAAQSWLASSASTP